jgi:hypothetical protein
MKLSRYGPFPCSPIARRPPLKWPNGAHVALWVIATSRSTKKCRPAQAALAYLFPTSPPPRQPAEKSQAMSARNRADTKRKIMRLLSTAVFRVSI